MQGVRNPGGLGGPGPPNILEKNVHKIHKKGTLKFSWHYLGPLNIYHVAHALSRSVVGKAASFRLVWPGFNFWSRQCRISYPTLSEGSHFWWKHCRVLLFLLLISLNFNSLHFNFPIELLKVSWLYEMQLSHQIWRHTEYGSDLFFELKLVSLFNSVESWLV